jgi:L-ascorbate metabolism protein UlaG (beta-lactamase superfamily)
MIDCGIPFDTLIKKYDVKDLRYVFISHAHGDHINIKTLQKIKSVNKRVMFFSNEEIATKFKEQINFRIFKDFSRIIITYGFKELDIQTIPLYHKSGNGEEITNHGFLIKEARLIFDDYVHFHATDTFKLDVDVIGKVDGLTLEFGHNKDNFNSEELEIWNVRNFVSHLDEKKAIGYVEKILKEGGKLYPAHMGNSIKKEQLKAKLIEFEVVEWWLENE